jgi:hypothetical protein
LSARAAKRSCPEELVGRTEARGHLAWLEQKTGVRLAAGLRFRSRRSSTAAPVVATLELRDRVQAVIYAYEAGLGARGLNIAPLLD